MKEWRTTRTERVQVAIVVLASLVLGASACESEPESSATSPPMFVTTPSTTAAVAPATTTTTTTTVPIDLLASCVDHAKFQAFTGNRFWASIWDDAGRTDAGMRAACEFLATDRPGWLDEVHVTWLQLQQLGQPAPTTTTAP